MGIIFGEIILYPWAMYILYVINLRTGSKSESPGISKVTE